MHTPECLFRGLTGPFATKPKTDENPAHFASCASRVATFLFSSRLAPTATQNQPICNSNNIIVKKNCSYFNCPLVQQVFFSSIYKMIPREYASHVV
jgi:hypothetical protein